MSDAVTGDHVATIYVSAVDRTYQVTSSAAGLHFYRRFKDTPDDWHHEGDAPGVLSADWRAALQRHCMGSRLQ